VCEISRYNSKRLLRKWQTTLEDTFCRTLYMCAIECTLVIFFAAGFLPSIITVVIISFQCIAKDARLTYLLLAANFIEIAAFSRL